MGHRAASQALGSLGCALNLFFSVTVFLFLAALLAQSAPAPQQAGAVPLPQGIADLADKLAKGIPQDHPMTVAVTDFPDSIRNKTCGLGRFVAERLATLLSQHPQCKLIERRRLDLVLNELKFSMSELVEPAKARKLGQMLGVQGLVLGSLSDLGGTFDIDARIIDIQTSVSLPGVSASIVQDEVVRRLSSDCGQTLSPLASEPQRPNLLPPSSAASELGGQQAVEKVAVENLSFEVTSCKMSGGSVTCGLL